MIGTKNPSSSRQIYQSSQLGNLLIERAEKIRFLDDVRADANREIKGREVDGTSKEYLGDAARSLVEANGYFSSL